MHQEGLGSRSALKRATLEISPLVSHFTVIPFDRPESSGLSFQLASLDETGVLNIWVGKRTLRVALNIQHTCCTDVSIIDVYVRASELRRGRGQ